MWIWILTALATAVQAAFVLGVCRAAANADAELASLSPPAGAGLPEAPAGLPPAVAAR